MGRRPRRPRSESVCLSAVVKTVQGLSLSPRARRPSSLHAADRSQQATKGLFGKVEKSPRAFFLGLPMKFHASRDVTSIEGASRAAAAASCCCCCRCCCSRSTAVGFNARRRQQRLLFGRSNKETAVQRHSHLLSTGWPAYLFSPWYSIENNCSIS